jgi:hypothetical protein
MSENPTSDEIDEGAEADAKLERDAEQSADAIKGDGYGGPAPENETGGDEPDATGS